MAFAQRKPRQEILLLHRLSRFSPCLIYLRARHLNTFKFIYATPSTARSLREPISEDFVFFIINKRAAYCEVMEFPSY
jgi:hypothetical protein